MAQQEILVKKTPQDFLKRGKPIVFNHTGNEPETDSDEIQKWRREKEKNKKTLRIWRLE